MAYRASLVSVHHSDDLLPDKTDAEQAIHDAVASEHAHVVEMAWGSAWYHDAIADEIRYHWKQTVFVGAAGTTDCAAACNWVVFPAEMEEVIAVTAVNWTGERADESHYGPELDLVAFHELPTQGLRTTALNSVGASSAASGVVAGVADLVWSVDTNQVADSVRARILRSGDCFHERTYFAPMVNARAAVGGLCTPGIRGPTYVSTDNNLVRAFSANVTGGRSQKLRWSNGQTAYTANYTFDRRNYDAEIWLDIRDTVTGEYIRSTKVVHVISSNEGPFVGASMDGAFDVPIPAMCRWVARTSGGGEPKEYSWFRNGVLVKRTIRDSVYSQSISESDQNFELTVVIVDTRGVEMTVNRSVALGATSFNQYCISEQ